ncbi:MAG: sensor histidine kinase [Burkholderiaceae bacterium]
MVSYLNLIGGIGGDIAREHTLGLMLAFEAMAFSLALGVRIRLAAREAQAAKVALLTHLGHSAQQYAELQERERVRFASDLHDSVGHDLAMLSSALERMKQVPDQAGALLDEARGLARRTLRDVRRVSHAIHPSMLEHLGWNASVENMVGELQRVHGIDVSLEQPQGPPALSPARRLHLFRVLQELLSNVARHSGADHCSVRIRYEHGHVVCLVVDNGVGLDTGEMPSHGLGLHSIEQRMRALDGRWAMTDDPDGGVSVRLQVPIDADPRRD